MSDPWTSNRLQARLQAVPPSMRGSPGPDGEARPRGDHDLNPELYDASKPLRRAAVLVPIVAWPEPTLLLTKRTAHLRQHAGQIAFPGGRIETGDRDEIDAALRETEEEIGVPREAVSLIGRLDTYVTRTGFEVTPLVGLLAPPLALKLDPSEVDEAFEVPLNFILAAENRQLESRIYAGARRHFFVYPYENYYIWGATAGMLSNLAEILQNDLAVDDAKPE